MYGSIALTREISGFADTINITDARIAGKISIADGMIDNALLYRYQLPLPYHRQCTLTFSGTVSGSGEISFSANGTTYTIGVTNGMSSSQVADMFNMVSSTDFIQVAYGNSNTLTLISISDSTNLSNADAQVSVITPSPTLGITITASVRSNRYPPLITNLSSDLAAALLLQDEYGVEAENTPKDGFKRLRGLNDVLMQLQGNSSPALRLFDEVTKVEFANSSYGNPRSYPNNASSSSTDPVTTTAPIAKINAVF